MRLDLGEGRDIVVEVVVGDEFELTVSSPGATGYSWELEFDDEHWQLLSRELVVEDRTFGGSVLTRFVLMPIREGTSEFRLRLAAPWKKEVARDHRLSLTAVRTGP